MWTLDVNGQDINGQDVKGQDFNRDTMMSSLPTNCYMKFESNYAHSIHEIRPTC